MSNLPAPTPSPLSARENYSGQRVLLSSGWARTAMWFGIFSLLLSVVLVGFFVAPVALLLGIIALLKIHRRKAAGMGFALTGIALGVLGLFAPLLFIPTFGTPRAYSNRSACGASLTGIVKSMILYSADNSDQYPLVLPPITPGHWAANAGAANGEPDTWASTEDAVNGYYGTAKSAPGKITQRGNPMACLWLMVSNGNVSPKQFICKSDPAMPKPAALSPSSGSFNDNFQTDAVHFSYGFAYMWDNTGTPGAWWKNTVDSSLPLGSDVYSTLAPGTNDPDATSSNIEEANSKNHNREGQQVVFADSHVEWTKSPTIGQNGDNIFKVGTAPASSSNTATHNSAGIAPPAGSAGAFDTIMVPARNAAGTGW